MAWKKVQFRGMDCIVFEGRPGSEKYPREDYFYYAMRHGESDWACPITIEKFVCANYWGLIGAPKPLSFSNEGCLELDNIEAERFAERG